MKRILASILILGSLASGAYAATMHSASSMDMDHDMPSHASCGGTACAATSGPAMPQNDCVDHCLSASQVPAVPTSPVDMAFAAVSALAVILAIRLVAPTSSPNGAPPHLGPSLRTLALAGVIMRN